MKSIALEDFRCFRKKQNARLAPVTLLVGDNSTGKTSFMAMIRALGTMLHENRMPDFKEDPYDLGSFEDIAHHRGRRGSRASSFSAWLDLDLPPPDEEPQTNIERTTGTGMPSRFSMRFGPGGAAPVPSSWRLEHDYFRMEMNWEEHEIELGLSGHSWKVDFRQRARLIDSVQDTMGPLRSIGLVLDNAKDEDIVSVAGSDSVPKSRLAIHVRSLFHSCTRLRAPHASAPVRSRPRRTYDPARPDHDAEGRSIPVYLLETHSKQGTNWSSLKEKLETFGRGSGLFDEIEVKRMGAKGSDPFQLHLRRSRKRGERRKGPRRNLIDVGYGVSQVLPILVEMLRDDAPSGFLLQQPEVHLHPSAQAALGSLFCEVAGSGRQLIIETHSDHLVDRVRMDVRDGKGKLTPEDVSILFFEQIELDVKIHSIRLDNEGNVLDAPDSYRKFFMQEINRSLGF